MTKEMEFKEALIAYLQGEDVEVNYNNQGWSCFSKEFSSIPLAALKPVCDACGYEFRLAPSSSGAKINWPEDAQYRAIDADGQVHFFEAKPEVNNQWSCWDALTGDTWRDTDACPSWRSTLIERGVND